MDFSLPNSSSAVHLKVKTITLKSSNHEAQDRVKNVQKKRVITKNWGIWPTFLSPVPSALNCLFFFASINHKMAEWVNLRGASVCKKSSLLFMSTELTQAYLEHAPLYCILIKPAFSVFYWHSIRTVKVVSNAHLHASIYWVFVCLSVISWWISTSIFPFLKQIYG